MKWTNRIGKHAAVLTMTMMGMACLARPVGKQPPTTKVNFTSTISQQAVDKVDLLFAIDNSASMGDKQAILAEAVPNLIEGLLKPRCVTLDANGNQTPTGAIADPLKNKDEHYGCTGGSDPEFTPVTDMHIGIVSSSLGNFGGDVCDAQNPRTNDRGHLVNIKKGGGVVDLAAPKNFLSWFPQSKGVNDDPKRHPVPDKPIGDLTVLSNNFGDLVVGIDQTGCGLEAQLEAMYRFLIQPDPWDVVKLDNFNQADLGDGVDIEVLQQRADFLRPDSLVAIIMLTDEDDSSSDPLAVGGQGWAFMAKNFPGSKVFRGNPKQGTTAPRGTTACGKDPGSADCTSCGFQSLCDASQPSCQKIKQDPNCSTSGQTGQTGEGYNGYYGPTDDELNVRFHRMKERYGIDPQYPIKRYIDGLTKFRVPDRKAEHAVKVAANGRRDIASYTSTAKCTNPLFASKLPRAVGDELCNLGRSTRSPDLIFFAVVGGVPNELLHFVPNDADKSRITSDDWIKILGRDPLNFNYDGIDPHMIQSVAPRLGLDTAANPSTAPRGSNGNDKINGREWKTEQKDLQYACTFDLPVPRDCVASDTSCDCGADATGNPPLCGAGTQQVKAKAYPTIREFEVVHALGDQGVIASLCPIQLKDKNAPDYGYKPAVAAIIDRLKNALTVQCLPQRLRTDRLCATNADCITGETCTPDLVCTANTPESQKVDCIVLAQLNPETGNHCGDFGLAPPKKEILDIFLEQQRQESGNVSGDAGLNLASLEVCEVPQKQPYVARGDSCQADTTPVWCYVENAQGKAPVAGKCPQALIFSTGTSSLVGARFSLQCINQFSSGTAAGDKKQ